MQRISGQKKGNRPCGVSGQLWTCTHNVPALWAYFYIHCLTGSLQGRQKVRTVDPMLQMRKWRTEKALDQPSGHQSSSPLLLTWSIPTPISLLFPVYEKESLPSQWILHAWGRIFVSFIHSFIHGAHPPYCPLAIH